MKHEKHPMPPRKWGLALALGLMLGTLAAAGQTSSTYTNLATIIYLPPSLFPTFTGNTVPYPPQIDATNFVNRGNWGSPNDSYFGFLIVVSDKPPQDESISPFPYTTSHTLNYTNVGMMLGTIGWEFDYGPLPSGGRGMAANFYNGPYNPTTGAGLIEARSVGLENPMTSPYGSLLGYVTVSATNIINKGALVADPGCEIGLTGTNVNLSRSFVYINPVSGVGSVDTSTNFTSDTAIYDEYWAQTNRNGLVSDAIWDGTTVTLPPFVPINAAAPCGGTVFVMLSFVPSFADSTNYVAGFLSLMVTNSTGGTTNVMVATNIIRQAAFVAVSDPNIGAAVGFSPSTVPSNNFQTVTVELQSTYGDTLFVVDTLASSPTRGLLPNLNPNPAAACSGTTYRPTNYIVERSFFGPFGSPGGGFPTNNFFFENTWSNRSVNAEDAAYSCFVDNQAAEPPSNPGSPLGKASSVTNLPGRIHITAGNLNLSDTVMRGEGEVVITANHLASSQNASVDCENLSYNLATTNGFLSITGLVAPSVVRFHGTNSMCSAVWTNITSVVIDNYTASNSVDTNTMATNTIYIYTPLTNTVQIGLHVLLVDASQMSTVAPVTVYDLLLHSTNMVIDDSMNVIETFLLDGPSFTLNANLSFPGISPVNPISGTPFVAAPIQNWVYTMAPTLRYFTNNAVLTIPNSAHFGDDGPMNYLAFVNNGSVIANDQTIDSSYFLINNGLNESLGGDFIAWAGTMVLSNALISANGDIDIYADNLFIDPSILSANYALNFTVTNSLSDGGVGAGNGFSCENGFNLWVKPQTGDLWGTTITTVSMAFNEVDHVWAGTDYGPNGAGFTNNASLGTLVLSPQNLYPNYFPLFYFSGTSVSNGLYVGTLDLTQLGTNINDMLGFDPSLTIYYAHALVGFTPPGSQTPEQYLDGQFDGHLRWVSDFSALTVAKPSIVPNGKLSANYLKPGGQFQITMNSLPGQSYIVQVSTNLVNWVPLFTNSTPVNGLFQYVDPQAANYPSRFYRIVPGH